MSDLRRAERQADDTARAVLWSVCLTLAGLVLLLAWRVLR